MLDMVQIYCDIDDFVKHIEQQNNQIMLPAVSTGKRKRKRPCKLSPAEIMTILVLFQSSKYRTFKDFYVKHVCMYLRKDFPDLVSYNRMVELTSKAVS